MIFLWNNTAHTMKISLYIKVRSVYTLNEIKYSKFTHRVPGHIYNISQYHILKLFNSYCQTVRSSYCISIVCHDVTVLSQNIGPKMHAWVDL